LFIPDEKGTYTVFFSGHSKLGDAIGRQFVWADVNVTDGSLPPHGIANRCLDIPNRCLDPIPNRCHGIPNQCPSGTCNPVDENGLPHGTSVCKNNEDGSTSLYTYNHGVLEGYYGSWNKDCVPIYEHGNYVNNLRDGIMTLLDTYYSYVYYGCGYPSYHIDTYVNGILDGYSGCWNILDCTPTGGHGNYVNGQKDGVWIGLGQWYDSYSIYTYANGILNGYSGIWKISDCTPIYVYPHGHGNYINGQPDGVWTFVFSEHYYIHTYVNGVLNGYTGAWKIADCTPIGFYLPNNNYCGHGNYVNGKKEGVWTEFDKGYPYYAAYAKATYVNDVLHGSYSEWSLEGKPTGCNGNYVNGLQNGVWTCYNSDGTTYTETWVNGVLQE